MRFLVFFILIVSPFFGNSIGNVRFLSARHFGLGGASVALVGGATSLENIGTIALTDTFLVHIGVKNNFIIKDLTTYGGGFICPSHFGVFGVSFSKFGNTNYSENKLGIVYGKKLSDKFSLGVKLNYQRLQQYEYGNKGALTTEIGFVTNISDQLSLGAHVYNPFGSKVSTALDRDFRLQSGVRIGLKYNLKDVLLLSEIEGNSTDRFVLKTGVEYSVSEGAFFRIGYSFPTNQVSAGLGLKITNFIIDAYYQYHTRLGSNTGLNLSYVF